MMADLKTKQTDQSVKAFLDKVPEDRKRNDSWEIVSLMEKVTGEKPKMWGEAIVGFGVYKYKYASGRTGEMPLVGFSPRKQNMTLYIMAGFDDYDRILERLGKYKTGKACLYINKLADVDEGALEDLVRASVEHVAAQSVE
jgi:hypothetical protein